MPLDPALVPLATWFESVRQPLTGKTAEEVRSSGALMADQTVPVELRPAVGSTRDLHVDGAAGPIAARLYLPEGVEGPMPTVVFFHGGGFVIMSIESHDAQAREICRRTGSAVLSVDYRLAPEAPYPAGVDDAEAATRWALAHVDELGGDVSRVAVAGDSAGGNLAAVVAQTLRDRVSCALLLYPTVDFVDEGQYPSYDEHAEDGVILTAEAMRWFEQQYVDPSVDRREPRLSPLHGDLAGLPPHIVTVAEMDPLRDPGTAYARALRAAGNRVTLLDLGGTIHGYFGLSLLGGTSEAAVAATCDLFRGLVQTATSAASAEASDPADAVPAAG